MDELRKQIDECDKKLIETLKERMSISKKIGKYKKENNLPIYDLTREKAVLNKLKTFANNDLTQEGIEKIYTAIFSASKDIQK